MPNSVRKTQVAKFAGENNCDLATYANCELKNKSHTQLCPLALPTIFIIDIIHIHQTPAIPSIYTERKQIHLYTSKHRYIACLECFSAIL